MPNSSEKGKRTERKFCRFLREAGFGAFRSEQVAGHRRYDESADVITSLDEWVRFEVKGGYNNVSPWRAEFQGWCDKAASETPSGKIPIIAWSPDYFSGWLFVAVASDQPKRWKIYNGLQLMITHELSKEARAQATLESPETWGPK